MHPKSKERNSGLGKLQVFQYCGISCFAENSEEVIEICRAIGSALIRKGARTIDSIRQKIRRVN